MLNFMNRSLGENIEPWLEWAEGYTRAELTLYGVAQQIGHASGVARRRERNDPYGLRQRTHTFKPIAVDEGEVRLSETAQYGLRVPDSHPDAALLKPTRIAPSMTVRRIGLPDINLARPPLLLTVIDEMPAYAVLCQEILDDPDTAQENQVLYAKYLDFAATALQESGISLADDTL